MSRDSISLSFSSLVACVSYLYTVLPAEGFSSVKNLTPHDHNNEISVDLHLCCFISCMTVVT
jgi:hypothetical protein